MRQASLVATQRLTTERGDGRRLETEWRRRPIVTDEAWGWPPERRVGSAADRGFKRVSGRRPRRLALVALTVAVATTMAGPVPAPEEARARAAAPSGLVSSIELSGTIDPATRAWLDEALDQAESQGVQLALIRLDTPGDLDTAMRQIVQRIVAAELPVIVYVAPDGARAASAGLFVTMAADVAAMAPQTNIGSATPVSIGPGPQPEVLGRKVTNDAAAYVRALAEAHGRNGDLAAGMVREAVNVTSRRARAENLVDVVAANERDLLDRLDGFRLEGAEARVLDTTGLRIERREMPFTYEVRQFLVNPPCPAFTATDRRALPISSVTGPFRPP